MTMDDFTNIPQRLSTKIGNHFDVNKELTAFATKHNKSKISISFERNPMQVEKHVLGYVRMVNNHLN